MSNPRMPTEGQRYKLRYQHIGSAEERILRGEVTTTKPCPEGFRIEVITDDGPRRVVVKGNTAEVQVRETTKHKRIGIAEL